MLQVIDILPLKSGSVFKNVDLLNLKFYSKNTRMKKILASAS